MTKGEVARRAGVGVETIRFYERQGLVPEPPPHACGVPAVHGGGRFASPFHQRAQQLGFSLREIEELLSPGLDSDASVADVRTRAAAKVREIDGRIRDLERMRLIPSGLI